MAAVQEQVRHDTPIGGQDPWQRAEQHLARATQIHAGDGQRVQAMCGIGFAILALAERIEAFMPEEARMSMRHTPDATSLGEVLIGLGERLMRGER